MFRNNEQVIDVGCYCFRATKRREIKVKDVSNVKSNALIAFSQFYLSEPKWICLSKPSILISALFPVNVFFGIFLTIHIGNIP